MRGLLVVLLLVQVSANALAQGPSPEAVDRQAALKAVQAFFDTMAAKDVEGARRQLMPRGAFHAMRERDGKPVIRAFTTEEYLTDLAGMKPAVRERMWSPEVRIHGAIAAVWTPYDFWIDGKFSHCGIDAFDLIKTDEGWKIAGGAYTVEAKCDPSPLGPLKQ
jgi:putative lumazine-binding protein